MNIANWLHTHARTSPQAPALYTGRQCVASYAQFGARAAALAALLAREHGTGAGDRIAIYAANRAEYLVALFAGWWLGAVVVPINFKLHHKEAAWIIANAEAGVVITDSGSELPAELLPARCHELGIDTPPIQQALRADGSAPPPVRVDPHSLAWLFYTSGTTGRPKGVMISHDNLMAMAMCYAYDVDQVGRSSAWLYAAPMSHGAGLYGLVFVRAGARHVVPASRGFDSTEIFELASQLAEVSLFAAPTMLKRMVRSAPAQVSGLRTIVLGGAPLYAADAIEALDTLGPVLAQIYGQGESPMTITAIHRNLLADRDAPGWAERITSVGTAQTCMEVRVTDPRHRELPVGVPGEVLARGPAVMLGYWRNEEATRETLVDGWLCTGDIGFMDEDGYLTLTDRSKDVIISGGSNIYPREVEEVLARHPAVFEVAVVGAPHPEWGEEVVAFVIARPGQTLDVATLEAWCRNEIASFKKPKRYIFPPELPRNSYGKILKTELRVLAAAHMQGPS